MQIQIAHRQEADKSVYPLLERSEFISFDLWDTLIRRKCHPEETKLRLCRYIWLRALASNSTGFTPVSLYHKRKQAEDSIATPEWEYRFTESMAILLKDSDLVENEYLSPKHLEEVELRIEDDATYIDDYGASLLTFVSHTSKKILLISDYYHSSEWLSRLLTLKDIKQVFTAIYASSDHLVNKRSAALFRKIQEQQSIPIEQWVHVGDNINADYNVPRTLNIDAIHLTCAKSIGQTQRHSIACKDHLHSTKPYLHTHRLQKLLDSLVDSLGLEAADPLFVSGVKSSSLFLGFTLRIIEDAFASEVDIVHFFSREGIFFERLYQKAVDIDIYDMGEEYPASDVLRVSRLATFGASLEEPLIDDLMRMWNLYSRQSLLALCKSLNLDINNIASYVRKYGLAIDEIIEYPWLDGRVKSFLLDKNVRKQIVDAIGIQKSRLLGYLSKHAIDIHSNKNLHIVDIGWRGTIQDNIALVLGNSHIRGTYLGIDKYLNKQPNNTRKYGYLCDNNDDSVDRHLDLGDVAILEFISNASGGSVIGYDEDYIPIARVIDGEERVILNQLTKIQDGIIHGLGSLLAYAKTHGLTSADCRSLSISSFSNLKKNPCTVLVDSYNLLHHNEIFGTGSHEQMLNCGLLDDLHQALPEVVHSKLSHLCKSSRWKESIYRSSHFGAFIEKGTLEQHLSIPSDIYSAINKGSQGMKAIVFMPTPISGSGGHRTILNIAKGLARAGLTVEVQLEEFNEALSFVEAELQGFDIPIVRWWQPAAICDIALATVGHSPEFVSKEIKSPFKFYLVQDYEASFCPMSDGYINIQNSYAYGLVPLCIGSWLPHVLKAQYGLNTFYAGLGVDTGIYRPISESTRRPQIAFLFQPEKGRRLSRFCELALAIVKSRIDNVDIISYGSSHPPSSELDSIHMGLVSDLEELNKLYNTSAVGLCVSLTNPSRIPFEMMAAGCIPVDVYRYNTLFDYASDTAVLAYQNPESLAAAILGLLQDNPGLESRSLACIDFAENRTLDWEIDTIVNSILYVVSSGNKSMKTPYPRYLCDPIVSGDAESQFYATNFCQWEKNQAGMVDCANIYA